MEKTTINLKEDEVQHLELILLEDLLKTRKKLDEDIDKNDKEAILRDFKNFVTNNNIKTKLFCWKER
jgi:hypothetical protein